MLIEVALALEEKLKGLSEAVQGDVTVMTDEGYAEAIAEAERKKTKPKYPIVVMRSKDSVTDRSRFQNDRVYFGEHTEIEDGVVRTYIDSDAPYIPENLQYQIDLVAESRREIDAMVLWVMRHIKERDYIDVPYKGYDGKDAVYCSLVKRGSIIRADDKDGNVTVLRRRIFELELTTLIDAQDEKSEPRVPEGHTITEHFGESKE